MATIQVNRGVFASLPTLADGEFYWATDTNQLFIGDPGGNQEIGVGGSGGGWTWQGAWASGTYSTNDVVEHNGSSWIAVAPITTEEPGIDPEWERVAQKGDTGATGAAGSNGSNGSNGTDASAPSGGILMYGGSSIPTGYLECDGSAVSRSTYAALFTAIGTTWGAGDGSTTFNIPDLRGRAPIGVGTGATLTARNLGTIGGAENHTLSTGELPSHTHQPSGDAVLRYTGSAGSYSLPAAGTDVVLNITIPNTGGGGAHNNMQPWAAVTYIIKT